jgi:hypothetical protein
MVAGERRQPLTRLNRRQGKGVRRCEAQQSSQGRLIDADRRIASVQRKTGAPGRRPAQIRYRSALASGHRIRQSSSRLSVAGLALHPSLRRRFS